MVPCTVTVVPPLQPAPLSPNIVHREHSPWKPAEGAGRIQSGYDTHPHPSHAPHQVHSGCLGHPTIQKAGLHAKPCTRRGGWRTARDVCLTACACSAFHSPAALPAALPVGVRVVLVGGQSGSPQRKAYGRRLTRAPPPCDGIHHHTTTAVSNPHTHGAPVAPCRAGMFLDGPVGLVSVRDGVDRTPDYNRRSDSRNGPCEATCGA